MKITLFSVEEANRALPELRPRVEELMRAKQELDRLERKNEVLSLAAAGASAANPDAHELAVGVERRARLIQRVRHVIHEIQDQGPVVKDIDRGLLDFYSLAGDRLVFLCWHLGENEVGHWHTLEGGFANRQPLDRSERE